ncbi:hypothetical protein C8F01DRAFT_1087792 [Mycena amicta]|nr:hypothetical protein C8F01DRAFT_1087792 [Mycena amicta]
MKFFTILLATAASAAATLVVPTVAAYTDADCVGSPATRHRPVDIWTGVPENAFCKAVAGSSLNITIGTEKNCQIDFFTTTNCNGTHGGWIEGFSPVNGCKTSAAPFSSVRILCITTG